jgi:hypothetical protein
LSYFSGSFYSALTQAWYVRALCKLKELRPGKYQAEIRRAFASLLIPLERGGVLLKKDYGWIVEEYPHQPPLYTLNGWMTAIRFVMEAVEILQRTGVDSAGFIAHNLDALEHLLPRYDAGFCLNSRYNLTGFTRFRLVADRPAALKCDGFEIRVAGEAPMQAELAPQGKPNRWSCFLERRTDRLLQFNIVRSLSGHPAPTVFRAVLSTDRPCRVRAFIADGDYDPMLTAMPSSRWVELSLSELVSGRFEFTGAIPFDDRNMFAYPTNFKKKFDRVCYNVYHVVVPSRMIT